MARTVDAHLHTSVETIPIRPNLPANIAKIERPPKEDLIKQHKTRFSMSQ